MFAPSDSDGAAAGASLVGALAAAGAAAATHFAPFAFAKSRVDFSRGWGRRIRAPINSLPFISDDKLRHLHTFRVRDTDRESRA